MTNQVYRKNLPSLLYIYIKNKSAFSLLLIKYNKIKYGTDLLKTLYWSINLGIFRTKIKKEKKNGFFFANFVDFRKISQSLYDE